MTKLRALLGGAVVVLAALAAWSSPAAAHVPCEGAGGAVGAFGGGKHGAVTVWCADGSMETYR